MEVRDSHSPREGNCAVDSTTNIMVTSEEIQWTVSERLGFSVLVNADQRISICGTEENLSTFANSILVAIAAKKVMEIANVQ